MTANTPQLQNEPPRMALGPASAPANPPVRPLGSLTYTIYKGVDPLPTSWLKFLGLK